MVSLTKQNNLVFHLNLLHFFLKINAVRNVDERIVAVVLTDQEAVPPLPDVVEIEYKTTRSTNHAATRIDVILLGSLALIREVDRPFIE